MELFIAMNYYLKSIICSSNQSLYIQEIVKTSLGSVTDAFVAWTRTWHLDTPKFFACCELLQATAYQLHYWYLEDTRY